MTSKFWEWFDATAKAAGETFDGKMFIADGFELSHTGGGCTAWEKPIAGTPWVLTIVSDDSSHILELDYPESQWLLMVQHSEGCAYSNATLESRSTATILQMAHNLIPDIQDGIFTGLEMTYYA
jgi:hypothetical protein